MTSSKRAALRAGVLGLTVGCVPAVWLVGWVAAAPPRPAQPAAPAAAPAPAAPAIPGGVQFGQFGQFGQAIVSPAQQELRSHFPFQSLADRLDYEKEAQRRQADKGSPARMTRNTEARLSTQEEGFEAKMRNDRTVRLMRLHTDPVPQLPNTSTAGTFGMFGGGFTPSAAPSAPFSMTREDLELPPAPALPFAAVRGPSDDRDAPPPPKSDKLAALHAGGLFDFLDPAGFGYVKDREHVAGFEPHQFRHTPELPPERGAEWAVVRLELVSLTKHDRPAVYVTDALPNLAGADRPETRELTAFEEKGLSALREGDDLATESSGDRIRMMGSLRAGKQCLDCHGVKRGDLLGAFSWELQRQPAEAK